MLAAEHRQAACADLYGALDRLVASVSEQSEARLQEWRPRIARDEILSSAANLAAYLAFREHDLRSLQDALVPLGLSSLGRCESHVLAALQAVRATLDALVRGAEADVPWPAVDHFAAPGRRLSANTEAIFGAPVRGRGHIMVTLSAEAAHDPQHARDLVRAGMDVARINCAHDDPDTWRAMAANVRAASSELGQPCRVSMDLAGPKMRVASVSPSDRRFAVGERVRVACADPALHRSVTAGASVWIDDGKVHARVVDGDADGMVLQIAGAGPNGAKIRVGDGLNAPGTPLPFAALNEKDLADLDTVVACADVVGQSFVREAADVEWLLAELAKRNARLPVIAKIETAQGIANLPDIIIAGAGRSPFGVMIARGDLAVEIGYERLAEMQEEMLWICEAADVPVVWATQVLDRLVRKGIPSRAEITDAAMAERAECVMLNKGPFVVDAVVALSNVLARMEGHLAKKSPRLRALHAWSRA